jgi:hypothetical protein
MAHRLWRGGTDVDVRAILAIALAVTACNGGSYQGSDGRGAGSNAGASSGGATSGASSGSFASNPVGTSGSVVVTSGSLSGSVVSSGVSQSGTTFSSGSVASGTSTSETTFGSGAGTSGTSTTDAAAFCRVPAVDAGSLPFVVDTVYKPSGWMGDAPAYPVTPTNPPGGFPATGIPPAPGTTARLSLVPVDYSSVGDACTPDGVGRSSANAKGACWKVTYTPFPQPLEPGPAPGMTKIGSASGYGWAGVFWQYPLNNWGNLGGGYPIPPGATTISFWARGRDGGEKVQFFTGEGDFSLQGASCSDYVATTSTNATFPPTPAWTHYTIDLGGLDYGTANVTPGQGPGGYFGGVLGAFGFEVEDQTLPSLDGGSAPPNEADPDGGLVVDPYVPDASFPPFFDSTITFYIDDIEFQ